jgi:subfamily B ATP-binding cassette protein MsbA
MIAAPDNGGAGLDGATGSSMDDKKRKISLSSVRRAAGDIIWKYRWRLVVGLVLLLIGRLCGMILPASTKFLIDEVIGNGRRDLLIWIIAAAGAGAVVQAGTSFSLAVLLGAAAQRSINDLRLKVQRHIGRLPVAYFDDHKSGELISRIMSDAEGVRNLVGTGFVQLIGGSITAVVAFSVLVWLNWRMTAIAIIFLVVFAVVMVLGFTRLRPIFRVRGKLNAEITGRLTETLGGIRVVKAYTAETYEENVFAKGTQKLVDQVVKSVVGASAMTTLGGLIFGLMALTLGVVGTREVMAKTMTGGELGMFVVFTFTMIAPLIQMSSISTQITEAFAGLDRIHEVLLHETEDVADAERQPVGALRGDIRFEEVSFEYTEGVPVLERISFEAPAGTTTALVGPSGAGKSTIIQLVLAFRCPTSGRVLVDGRDLETLRVRDYRSHLAVVLQDDFLFDGTIADNIGYGRSEASRQELEEAGRLAHCDEFVAGFEDGYDTVIGERGVKLSGGQRQRVTIARAILADPRILILDEATSSLDSESERLIQEGFAALRRGRTTFVIAHRLSTIRNADQILVIEDGAIVERGRHEELLALGGLYRSLYETQYRLDSDMFINPGEDTTPARESGARPASAEASLDLRRLPRD